MKMVETLRGRGENIVMCADWNIAHQEIDLRNPKSNKKNAGFLPKSGPGWSGSSPPGMSMPSVNFNLKAATTLGGATALVYVTGT